MKRTTINDVASRAGVGKVTVSYVLNGQSRLARISPETEQRVLDAAKELNYRPNALGRMLATRRTQCLAVVLQRGEYFSAGSGFTNEVMRGVCSAAVEEGFDLMLHTRTIVNPHMEADALSDGLVEGVLMLRDQDDSTLADLINRGLPCVQFFTRSADPRSCWVDADNFEGGRMAVQHLLQLGHTRIRMIAGSLASVSSNERVRGFQSAMRSAGLPSRDEDVLRVASPQDDIYSVREMLVGKDRATALFVWSDDVAFRMIQFARSLGLRIPDDLSIVGFDSLDACDQCVPPLTSVRQPIYEMASRSVRLLAALVRHESVKELQVVYPLRIDVRGSTATPYPTSTKR
ncbi:MAG: LacI family DNA-binding transcriptional regulator [Fimbriimonadaceae bacterium]